MRRFWLALLWALGLGLAPQPAAAQGPVVEIYSEPRTGWVKDDYSRPVPVYRDPGDPWPVALADHGPVSIWARAVVDHDTELKPGLIINVRIEYYFIVTKKGLKGWVPKLNETAFYITIG